MKKRIILLFFVLSSVNLFSQEVINNNLELNGYFRFGPTLSFGDWVKNWGIFLWFSHLDDNSDPVFMSRYNTAWDASELRVSIGDFVDGRDKFVIGLTRLGDLDYTPVFSVLGDGGVIIPEGGRLNVGYSAANAYANANDLSVNGNVGIGTLDTQGYKLAVNGTIRAKEIKVESNWADFVFKKDYKLPTLKEVEAHINEKGTLPNIPNESTIKADGLNLSEMNVLLLQKVEELTLYIIQQEKRIKAVEAKMK